MDLIELKNGRMAAGVAPLGAELRTLTSDRTDLLWKPDAALWSGVCPVLFPVIGRVNGDAIRVSGTEYPMPMHGFALTRVFSVVEQTDSHCTLELRATPETRRHYPYDFTLRMTYRLSTSMLQITAQIRNDGDVTLPASVGLHPGFRWPLVPGTPKDRHLITFSGAGPAFYTRPIDRLIGPDRFALSLEGPSLRLHEALFEPGGMAFLSLRSRSLCFHAEGALEAIRLDFPDMDNLILWSRPGGDFLCIEPLLGHADLIGFAGDIMDKPCMAHIAPCDTLALSVTIRLEPSPGATLDRPQKA